MHLLATLAALTPLLLPTEARASGRGTTTRYWDCCKPSCAWPGKASLSQGPLLTCDINDNPLSDGGHTESSCDGGGAFTCSSHSPWAVDDYLSYGWAAVKIGGQRESDWCCACYELRFTDGPLSGKKMVVQATDTGDSLADNHFDIAVGRPHAFLLTPHSPSLPSLRPTPHKPTCTSLLTLQVSRDPLLTDLDARWRRRLLQRLLQAVGCPQRRLGRALWRCHHP